MNTISFFNNKDITELLTRYLDAVSDVPGIMEKISKDLNAAKCIICVFGTQGSGKSSFLNALLFRDIVLPADADETTCIPEAVSYGKNKVPTATVFFLDGRTEVVSCTDESLKQYIHQNYNPANEKKVREVQIEFNHPLLEEGITFVDLPGVCSITPANQQIAIDYLRQATASVFMLRLGQPITNSDSFFIRYALPMFSQIFWLQNRWSGESDDEVIDGKSHNEEVLRDIARKSHYPEEKISDLDVVNIYDALQATIENNQENIRNSGFEAFEQKLYKFAKTWKENLEHDCAKLARNYVQTSVECATASIQRLSGDVQNEMKRLNEENSVAERNLDANREYGKKAKDFLKAQTKEIECGLETQCRNAYGNLRNAVREKIESGMVSGEYLNKAFQDCLAEEEKNIYEYVRSKFQELNETLQQNYFDNMKQSSLDEKAEASVQGNFSDKSKLPGYYRRIGTGIGAVGGIAAGAAVGSAIAPGVGTAVGFVVGAGITLVTTLLGNLVGSGARKIHMHYQKEEAKAELFKIISNYTKKALENYQNLCKKYCDAISAVIDEWLLEQEKIIKQTYTKRKAELEKPIGEKQSMIHRIQADIEELQRISAEL